MSDEIKSAKRDAASGLGKPVPVRPPGFCVGCPERPVFSAIKIAEKEIGKTHMTADVGCHIFSTLPPFNIGNTMLGYGLGLASSSGIAPNFKRRVISIMGDGGFWHNGLTTGVTSTLANGGDSILIIMKNGYAAATGGQRIPSSAGVARREGERAAHRRRSEERRRQVAQDDPLLQRRQHAQGDRGSHAPRRSGA